MVAGTQSLQVGEIPGIAAVSYISKVMDMFCYDGAAIDGAHGVLE
jgi:hypothetical protein